MDVIQDPNVMKIFTVIQVFVVIGILLGILLKISLYISDDLLILR